MKMEKSNVVFWLVIFLYSFTSAEKARVSLWLDAHQVQRLAGISTEIFVIRNGTLAPFLQDPNYDKNAADETLPTVPADIEALTINWEAGYRYRYSFEELISTNQVMMEHPILSIPPSSLIPRARSDFQIMFQCTGEEEGYAAVKITLRISDVKSNQEIEASPVEVRFRKQCHKVTTVLCNPPCINGGFCDEHGLCDCPAGFYGPTCQQALCQPHCYNDGICLSPGVCICQEGFHGKQCELGICDYSCGPNGLCVQPGVCKCHRNWYGKRCDKRNVKARFPTHHKKCPKGYRKKHHKRQKKLNFTYRYFC
ncbi:wnt inhibitory factor 1-like [Ptychodera flava]|uniref:wnt inhibitory factor 1-like n=1 Tax=Ptychodera flava TaxID=63121 RepID=UPI00396A2635